MQQNTNKITTPPIKDLISQQIIATGDIKKPLDPLYNRIPEELKIPTIFRLEELKASSSENLNHKYFIKNHLFNSAGYFYKRNGIPDYYVYLFEVDEYVKALQIKNNNEDLQSGLNERLRKWPIAGFYFAEKNKEISATPEIDISSIGVTPGTSQIEVSKIGLHYIPYSFDSISEYAPAKEYAIPNNFFNLDYTKNTLYVAVVSKYAPSEVDSKIELCSNYADRNKMVFFENPVAEALYDGDLLVRSMIIPGMITQNGKYARGGLCLWNTDPLKKVKNNGKDFLEFEAICYNIKFKQTLERNFAYEAFISGNLDYFFKPSFNVTRYNQLLSYVRRHYDICGKFNLQVPVFKKINNQKDVFLWFQNGLVKPEMYYGPEFNGELKENAPENLKKFNRHSKYPNLFDSYSLQEIYPNLDSLETVLPEEAARKLARALIAQPRGRRSVSIEGDVFEQLFGGAIEIADRIKTTKEAVEKPEDNNPEQLQKYNEYINDCIFVKRQKNFLHSMVYFEDSEQNGLCGEGYIFYDAPIHYDNPKIKDVDASIKQDYCERLRKLYTNKNVRNDDNTDGPISGAEALQNLLDKIFGVLQKRFHIEVDFIYCDFEGMRNTANEIRIVQRGFYIRDDQASTNPLDATRDQVWDSICKSLHDRKDKETESYRKIYDNLEKRGYAFTDEKGNSILLNDVKSCRHSKLTDGRCSSGYNVTPTYARRRNINIWDCVMMEYYAGLLDKYLVTPIRHYSPKAIRSLHSVNSQAGYINHHQNGSDFETYLGGSVKNPIGMRSNPSLYTLKMDAFEKDSMDNWKTYIPKVTPFARLKFYINNVRAAMLSNPSVGVHPFIATQYSWNNYSCNRLEKTDPAGYTPTNEQLKTVYDSSQFHREMLIHSWMCRPEITYAYFDYNYDSKRGGKILQTQPQNGIATFEQINSQDYFKVVFGDTQKTIRELDKIFPQIIKPISLIEEIIPENSPFILSGWQIGKLQIYRITLEEFCFDSFKNIRYMIKPQKGILHAKFPKLRKRAYLRKDLLAKINGKTVVFPNGFIFRHEKGPGRWIVIKGNKRPYVLTTRDYYEANPSLDMPKCSQPVIRKGKSVSTLDNTSVFGDIARNQKWEATVKLNSIDSNTVILGEKLGNKHTQYSVGKEYKFTREIDLNNFFTNGDNVRPLTFLDIATETNEATNIKAFIQGANVRVDIYREDDGINIGRVTKEITNEHFREAKIGDTVLLKVSWLNATNNNLTYIVEYNINGMETFTTTINCMSGDEGYKIFHLGLIPKKATKITANIHLKNETKILHKVEINLK